MKTSATPQQLSFPFQVFEEEIVNPLNGQQMTETEEFIATLLLDASSEKPIKMAEIINAVADAFNEQISERQVKIIIRSFRRERGFPILTRRSKPAGYWWCVSQKDMQTFEKMWLSQVMDELITLQIMKKRNYPRLAGQLRLPNVAGK